MTDNGKKLEERQARLEHARVDGAGRRAKEIKVMAAVAVVAGAAALIYLVKFADINGGGGYSPASPVGNETDNSYVVVPAELVGTTAKYYTYDANGTDVRIFVVKGSDGKIHVAADACDVCYALHKGYSQEADKMKCNNCGKVFAINDIGTKNTGGGCWPSYIPIKVENGQVLIKKSDLGAKVNLFS